jgi:DNA-binding transcriptional MerR regulator
MNRKEIADSTGLTYAQIRHLSNKVGVLSRNKDQGHDCEFSVRDLELFRMAAYMKSLKHTNKSIYEMLNYIDKSGLLDRGWL